MKVEVKELLEELYMEWIEDYCNVTFDKNKLPPGILLTLNELVATDPKKFNLASEKIGDMSKVYKSSRESGDGMPGYIRDWLSPYVRPHLVGDKRKKPYQDGR